MGAKQGLSPNTVFVILPNGLPNKSAIPLFTIKEDTAIKGKSEGIRTFRHISIPESAPFAHSFEKTKSIIHTIIIPAESTTAAGL